MCNGTILLVLSRLILNWLITSTQPSIQSCNVFSVLSVSTSQSIGLRVSRCLFP
jgi:hypothetical protein